MKRELKESRVRIGHNITHGFKTDPDEKGTESPLVLYHSNPSQKQVSRLIPMKRELKGIESGRHCFAPSGVSRLIPMKRELKGRRSGPHKRPRFSVSRLIPMKRELKDWPPG